MMRSLVLGSAVLAVVLGIGGGAEAQQGSVTEQCGVIWTMQWLSQLSGSTAGADALAARERAACGAGLEAGPHEVWDNGTTFRSGDSWYYPNGTTYYSGGSFYYPNGTTFSSGGTYYYPSGTTLFSGGTYYDERGSTSSESALIGGAITALPRARGDDLLGRYRDPATSELYRMIYLVAMVTEASP